MDAGSVETATLESISTPRQNQIRSAAWKPLIEFWSVISMIGLFLGYGAWVLYGIGGRAGSLERPVNLALLFFYATSLPACVYFAWRGYRKLKMSSR